MVTLIMLIEFQNVRISGFTIVVNRNGRYDIIYVAVKASNNPTEN